MFRNLIVGGLLLFATFTYAQNIAINTTGNAPHNSAMLDITANNRGLLIPRMTLVQRNNIAAPATGLLIYQTNNTPGFYYFDGTVWLHLGANNWRLTGNAGTNATTNFIGTTDNQALRIRTNNAARLEITTTGQLRAFYNGTAAAPTYSFNANTNTGIYRPAANSLGFSTSGVERVRIGSFNGSVGIGRVPCCGGLGGSMVDIFQPLEVGNDDGINLQATIGYWYAMDVAIQPELSAYGFVGYSTRPWWRMYSLGYFVGSERAKKKEIMPINQNKTLEELVMQDIKKISPSFYYYKQQNNTPAFSHDTRYRPHFQLGVIVDESPDYILDESLSSVDVYAVASLSLAGVKYNHTRINEIESKLTHSMTINDFGSISEQNNWVFVKYDDAFISELDGTIPTVNITPVSERELKLRIAQKTNDGFEVIADADDIETISFDWFAIAKVSATKVERNTDPNVVDENILKKIHLTPEEKQKVINHYSNIEPSSSPRTE